MESDTPKPLVWDDTTLRRFWAYYAQFPQLYFSHQSGASVVAKVAARIGQGASVLDYGCGPGHLLPHLVNRGFQVVGADLTRDTMAAAEAKVAGRAGFQGLFTIEDLLRQGRMFDAVFLLEVVEHLDDRWLKETLANVRRLLKPGGSLVVTTPNEENLEDSMVYCPVSNVTFHRWQHVRSWSRESLRKALQDAGFARVDVETCTFASRQDAARPLLRRLVHQAVARWRKQPSLFAVAQSA